MVSFLLVQVMINFYFLLVEFVDFGVYLFVCGWLVFVTLIDFIYYWVWLTSFLPYIGVHGVF